MRKLLVLMGVPIDDLDMPAALARIDELVREGRETGAGHQIVTVNADFLIKAHGDPELRQILQEADLATADGMPLVWSAKLLGVPLPGRVTGADLVPAVAELAAREGYSLYLLGGAPGVPVRAAQVLRERCPELRIVGAVSPPYRSVLEAEEALVDDIRRARPDILLVAFGNPKQEKWIAMHAPELGVPVMMGVGGSLDFIAGTVRRAPEWMQRSGMEWLYRLRQEPGRLWRRYVVDLGSFGYLFARQWWTMRYTRESALILTTAESVLVDGVAILGIEGALTVVNQPQFLAQVEEALPYTTQIVINLARTSFIDSSGYGTLVAVARRARAAGGDLRLAGMSSQVARVLALLKMDNFFETYPDVPSAMNAARRPAARLVREAPAAPAPAGWQVLQSPRRLDALTAPEFRERCVALLARSPRLIVDLSPTVFLASAGLAALIALTRQAEQQGGQLRLAAATTDAVRVVKIARLESILALYPDLTSAAS